MIRTQTVVEKVGKEGSVHWFPQATETANDDEKQEQCSMGWSQAVEEELNKAKGWGKTRRSFFIWGSVLSIWPEAEVILKQAFIIQTKQSKITMAYFACCQYSFQWHDGSDTMNEAEWTNIVTEGSKSVRRQTKTKVRRTKRYSEIFCTVLFERSEVSKN